MRALVELFESMKEEHRSYRKYLLERVDGELVFRQTEVDAAIENAIASLYGSEPSPPVRHRKGALSDMTPSLGFIDRPRPSDTLET